VFELDFKKLESYASRPHYVSSHFRSTPRSSVIWRSWRIEAFEAQAVLETIAQLSDLPVESVRVFDLYRGNPLAPGKKSLAYSIAYRASDRTLTDEEVNRLHQRLIERVDSPARVELRGREPQGKPSGRRGRTCGFTG